VLNHQLIKVDAEGRLRATLDLPVSAEDFNGGTPTKDGLLCITETDGVYFVNGLGYGLEQRAASEQVASGVSEGNPFTNARGRLRAAPEAPMFWLYGLPFTEDGRLSVVIEGLPPVDTGAYSNAYSNAFDVKD
jgi:hypothetical protein